MLNGTKIQRRFRVGQEYSVVNRNGKGERKVVYVGPAKLDGREHLVFRPVRRAQK